MSKKIQITCKQCGKIFEDWPSQKAKFCSTKCSNENHSEKNRIIKTCPVCNKTFSIIKSNIRECCSYGCANTYRSFNSYNLSFLDTDTPFRSWFLGWIMSDGHVSKSGRIYLSISDKSVVQRIAEEIKYAYPIVETEPKGHAKHMMYSISFKGNYQNKIKSFGFPFGVKSGKEFIPACVSNNTFSHFIRGMIEGDGTIGNYKNRLSIRLCCMSKQFLEDVFTKLKKLKIVYGGSVRKTGTIYTLDFAHSDSTKLGEYIYKDSENIRLDRKYNIYLKCKDNKLKFNKQPDHCSFTGCTNKCVAKGYCNKHYTELFRKEKVKEYYEKNKDVVSAKNKEKWKNNTDGYRDKKHIRYIKNRDKIKEYMLEYNDLNRDHIKKARHAYYLRKKLEKQALNGD